MSGKYISIMLFALTLCAFNTALAAEPNIIAEYTNVSDVNCRNDCTFYCLLVSTEYTQAMAFDVVANPTATEVQLQLSRRSSSHTGQVVMQLRADSGGAPAAGVVAEVSRDVNELLVSYPTWFSFELSPQVPLSQGRYWIVCKVTDAGTELGWHMNYGNNYGTGADTKTSEDGGSTWPKLKLLDLGFRVFGLRTKESTTTIVTTDPNVVRDGPVWVEVSVRDSQNNPVQGPGEVLLSASGGLFTDSNSTNITLTLEDGDANAMWRAPSLTGSEDINAFYQGHTYSSVDYNDSNSGTTIMVIGEDRPTTTTLNFTSADWIFTEGVVDMNVTVIDSSYDLVTGGKVLFSCTPKSGTFGADSIDIPTGRISNTWRAGLDTGDFTIKASYVGGSNAGGTIIYGPSDSNDTVTVDYNDVDTDTSVWVSPSLPYVGFSTFIIVSVRDEFGNLVPGGTVKLQTTPSYGTFNPSSPIKLDGGMGYTEWLLPSYKPAGLITVNTDYEWLTGGYTAGGKRYLGSQAIKSGIRIREDDDSTGSNLSWMTEWIRCYEPDAKNLDNTGKDANGFANSLQGWTGWAFSNDNAWEDHMKGNIFGQEDGFMDEADFTYFAGHGNANYVLFSSSHDNTRLNRNDCYNSWGNKDAEWAALAACYTMSNSRDWARAMDGLHAICGYITVMGDSAEHGGLFGSFLRQRHAYDRPHTVVQSWFLTGDQSQTTDKKQRVIGDEGDFDQEYLWGQGYVRTDPVNDDKYWGVSHDVGLATSPLVDAGGPYTDAVAGQLYQLDGSGTVGLSKERYYFFVWDLDKSTNTDDGDWDNKGGDGFDDDADAWGRRPQWVFPIDKIYNIRLMVIDDDWQVDEDSTWVDVASSFAAAAGQAAQPVIQSDSNGIEIVDNFNPNDLPTESYMQGFDLSGYTGYDEMLSIMQFLEVETEFFSSAGLDELGNYTTSYGDDELIVNQYTGAITYIDTARAYISPNMPPAPELPTDANAIIIADNFISTCGINKQGAVFHSVIDICLEESDKGSRTCTSRIPFQKCVNYQRMIQSLGQPYPVVGPGGQIRVLMDANGVVMFTKNCRQVAEGEEVPLTFTPQQAVTAFHNLGPSALMGGSVIPAGCSRIEINGVSLGYYEDDFVTSQTAIAPVYIFDLTCEDDEGAYDTDVYMSAVAAPLDPNIEDPCTGIEVDYGNPITFTGSAQGGGLPYSYKWESDVDGLLATDSNFTTSSLSINYQSDSCVCEVLPHVISLTVTDGYGSEATDYVKVTVQGACADFNRDGKVDLVDFSELASSWRAQRGQEGYDGKIDFDKDGAIDTLDLCALTSEWLQ